MRPSQVVAELRRRLERVAGDLVPTFTVTQSALSPDDHRHVPSDRLHQTVNPYGLGQANEGELIKHLSWSLFAPVSTAQNPARVRDPFAEKVAEVELLLGYEIRASRQQADMDAAVDLIHDMVARLWVDDAEPMPLTLMAIDTHHEVTILPAETLFAVVRARFRVHFEGEV